MHLEIITPEKQIFDGKVKLVQLPGSKGSFEVLNNHAPIISTLETGVVKVIGNDNQTHHFSIDGGVVEVKQNKIIVLAESV